MKEVKNDIDVVVIFKRITTRNLTMFKPQFIILGHLNEETMEFLDVIDQVTYKHLVINSNCPYGYGLRTSFKKLKALYGINDIEELFSTYLKELKERKYYFRYKEKVDVKNLIFISEDKKYGNPLIEKDKDLTRILKQLDPFYDINKLISNISTNIIGQDDAIEQLVSILWKNSRRENKNNILLAGPTGVGKTELIRTLEKTLNIPITTVDVSNFTKTGYKGDSVTDILVRAYNKCNGDINKVENSIIILDEFDKLAKTTSDDITTTGVQQELLKLLEDGEYTIELDDEIFYSNKVTIKTKGITFIVAGAFSGLFEEEEEKRPIGINVNRNETPKAKKKKQITPEDLTKYGIISEAIGRLHNIIVLNQLTLENLITIIKSPNSYILNDNIKIFEELGITVHIDESVYPKIAKIALDKKIGARGLIGTIENLFSKAALDAKRNSEANGYNYLEITEETVQDNNKYVLKKVKKEEKK